MCALVALALLASLSSVGPSTTLASGCRDCPDPISYCLTSPNSVGPGALISWQGAPSLDTDDFHLVATGCPPDQLLMFYYGAGRTQVVFGNGWRCADAGGVGLFRFHPFSSDSSGTAVMKVDYFQPPAGGGPGMWVPGDTWYCQAWYRDPAGGGAQFNLTDGLMVSVCHRISYAEMVSVPAGTFRMGAHTRPGFWNELPVHTVYLDAFWMDVYEVTNQKYADYLNVAHAKGRVVVLFDRVHQVGGAGEFLCDTHASSKPSHITWNGFTFGVMGGWEEHPMVWVSWYGACTYANQRSRDHGLTPCYDETTWACDFAANGYRLPTEAEWEYAARGGEHNPYFRYPWGNTFDGSKANYWDSGDPWEPGTTPVGHYDGNQIPSGVDMVNGYGLYDMAGNVRELCWDWYDHYYYSSSPSRNPTGPTSGTLRTIRNGSWISERVNLRSAERWYGPPAVPSPCIGFRVVARR